MATAPDGRPLVGRTVRLDPAAGHDAEVLFDVLDDDRVWEMGYAASSPRPRSAEDWRQKIEQAVNDNRVMYVVRRIAGDNANGGPIVGTTSLGDIDVANERAHLGWTAYSPQVWGT
ncbi:MAG TPA: GNAT family N-acetyltransferase, partial [Mycobacteriales bacterium]|nr:GNAT family N-acetyltransferase [Mycobacteriales bacterium]